jgi:Fe-S-cluster containining protein
VERPRASRLTRGRFISEMTEGEVFLAFEKHLADVDTEFRRVAERFSDRMQCRKGCSMCCSQMFSISLVEAAFISRAVKALPDDERQQLQAAAREYLARAPRQDVAGDGQETVLPRPGLRLVCPALKEDSCSIYSARPIICHKWGIPVFNPVKPLELQACELNFRPGEAIDVDGLLEPQVALLEDWVELKSQVNSPPKTATVAEALLFDYEELLVNNLESDE